MQSEMLTAAMGEILIELILNWWIVIRNMEISIHSCPWGRRRKRQKKINIKNKRKQFSKLFSYRATASKMELVFAAIPESGWKRSHRCHKPKSSKWRLCGFTLEKNWGNMRAKSCNAIGDGSIWTASSAFFSPLFAFNSNIKKKSKQKNITQKWLANPAGDFFLC